jgi:uncharacterized protein YlaN (UPF0358 family)
MCCPTQEAILNSKTFHHTEEVTFEIALHLGQGQELITSLEDRLIIVISNILRGVLLGFVMTSS